MLAARSFAPVLAMSVLAAACGGSSTPTELADPDVAPHPANPAGVAYPTKNLGPNVGEIIPNLAFEGYPDSSTSAGLTNVSLADFYDPTGKDHTVLFVTVAATWCSACASEASIMKSIGPTYRAKGVVMMEVLVAGQSSGYGPSQSELDAWVHDHATTWTVTADVRGRRLFGQLGFVGVPSSMLLDTRTMEIIHQASGAPDDLGAYLQLGVDWVAKHPL
jgi:thiol-disulfide isomerase/thioredoxin